MTLTTEQVEHGLATEWGLDGVSVVPHDRGMNSQTWLVRDGTQTRWVAKVVGPHLARHFIPGLEVAVRVQAAGIPAGARIETRDGRRWVRLGDDTLALLAFVPGRQLTGGDDQEQRLIGSILGRVHASLAGGDVPGSERFHWLDPDAQHLALEPWIRPAIVRALAGWEALPPSSLTWGLLHSDPAPEAFVLDPATGACGVLDWDRALVGPLMYDVASAVMYLRGAERARPFLDAYLETAALAAAEVHDALEPTLAIRWAVQADYFARRITANDLTGIAGPEDNDAGLEHARLSFERSG